MLNRPQAVFRYGVQILLIKAEVNLVFLHIKQESVK